MKRIIVGIVLISLVSLVWAGGQQETSDAASGAAATEAEPEPVVLRMGLNNPDGHPLVESMRDFAAILEEKSDGQYQVDFFTGGQLGDKQTHMTMLQTGSLDLYMIMGGFLSDYGVDVLEVMMLPYLFDNVAHARAVQESEIGDEILAAIQEAGTRTVGIGMFQEASRNFFFTDRAVTSIDEMSGLKIRAQAGSIYEELLESFGGSVVPVAFSELYSALQTGVVDGAEQPYSGYYSNRFYEIAPYYLLDGHETSPNYIIMSEMTWNSIPSADRELIIESQEEAIDNFNAISADLDQEMIETLEAEGVEILEPDNLQEWKDAAQPLYTDFAPGYGDLIERIRNTSY
ncbi:MAG: TRAP transporter substrate-binding protein [Spirochaeta sp.]|jgi:tripartite ATP-independent transporter DctP family solute receptor|nr:TRAP transporter substrate-binding protein [Spirochaeta sp.]